MATIADLLGAKAAEVKALELRPDPCVEAMHYVATGLPGSPYRKDSAGRLRRNGRWAVRP